MRYTLFTRTFFALLLSLGFVFLIPHAEAQALDAPTGLTGSNVGSTGFTVNWTAPTTTLTITGYDVRYKKTSLTPTYTDAGHTGTDTTVKLTGLTPNTPYMVQVRAVAGTQEGTWTVPFVETTLLVHPIDAPTGVTVSNKGSTGFTVGWTAPTETSGLTITGYEVRYRVATSGTYSDAGHTGTGTSVALTGLTPSTSYAVQIRALAGTETGIWSTTLYDSTLSQYPINPPTDLTVSNRSSTGFTVSWTAPTGTSGLTITGYDVEYTVSTASDYTDAGHTGTGTSATLTGLTPNTSYRVEIRALAGTEKSVWSSPVYTATLSQPASTADAVPGLSSEEQLLLGSLLTYDTIIFNEIHNGTDDANDWLELRNVSNIDIPLDNWQLSVQTSSGTAVIPFPAGTTIAANDVLLITNTEMATTAVGVVSFVLPQSEFALILRSPIAFGDIAGNYFQTEKERPETAPELTVDTAWERVAATTSGYRAEAWAVSTHRNGQGSPGYQPSAVLGDLNHDDVVNILDLVLAASHFGVTGPSAADLNGDNTVNIQDLVLIANALDTAAAAPSAKQPTAALVNTWLQLAQQHTPDAVSTSLPQGFSYARGIQMLEQLAAALTPEKTVLLANYPNPFNPETWIPYQLSKAADVTITIHASDGNLVRMLAFGHQDAGTYKNRSQAAYWDGKNGLGETVASGLYFYTLTAGDFSATRRMLILK